MEQKILLLFPLSDPLGYTSQVHSTYSAVHKCYCFLRIELNHWTRGTCRAAVAPDHPSKRLAFCPCSAQQCSGIHHIKAVSLRLIVPECDSWISFDLFGGFNHLCTLEFYKLVYFSLFFASSEGSLAL